MMSGSGFGVPLFAHDLRLTQCEHRTARVGEYTVDRTIANEILKSGAMRGAEHDETGMPLAPVFYVMAASVITTFVVLRLKETAHGQLG